jgi:hypothetical protein
VAHRPALCYVCVPNQVTHAHTISLNNTAERAVVDMQAPHTGLLAVVGLFSPGTSTVHYASPNTSQPTTSDSHHTARHVHSMRWACRNVSSQSSCQAANTALYSGCKCVTCCWRVQDANSCPDSTRIGNCTRYTSHACAIIRKRWSQVACSHDCVVRPSAVAVMCHHSNHTVSPTLHF